MIRPIHTRETFKNQPEDFRIGAVISDGMWYSSEKWRKIAKVSEEQLNAWIAKNLKSGLLIQADTGAKSYRFPLESIKQWYMEEGIILGEQLIDFLFPPRIWDNKTETEGFLSAPLREVGIVSFSCSPEVAKVIANELLGIARVRENEPNHYKTYCLDSNYVKTIIEDVFEQFEDSKKGKIYSRSYAKRRELVDFTPAFRNGLVVFYKNFGRTLLKGTQETINIFLPDPEDQKTQVVMWVIGAIEKFDESAAVPFSGYLNSVLKRKPYDLPYTQLGKELSSFQRGRAKAIDALKKNTGRTEFTSRELASEMGFDHALFETLDEQHRIWLASRNPTSLIWDQNSEEKQGQNVINDFHRRPAAPTDIALANQISSAVIQTAIKTQCWDDAFTLMSQIDINDINLNIIREVSDRFIKALGATMGIQGEVKYNERII